MLYMNASILSEALEVFYYDVIGKNSPLKEVRILTETGMFSQHFHSWLVVIEDQLHKHPKLLIILGSIGFSICF